MSQASSADGPADGPAHDAAKDALAGFESRKADHIRLAIDDRTQAVGGTGLSRLRLTHEAFPEIDLNEVDLSTSVFGREFSAPLFISSMTAGHDRSTSLNRLMAEACERHNWPMGVGSQRRQLFEPKASHEWSEIRKACPRIAFFGNIGLAQLIETPTALIRRLADSLEATAMIVHANPLQEALQPEGTPRFKGGLQALERLIKELGLPVIVKEVGCGFSLGTLQRLRGLGVAAVDVSGFGGTHWGRVEGHRSEPGSRLALAAETFRDWGLGTVEATLAATSVNADYEVWASGGVRSGLDAAKLVAVGARMVGFAMPIIEAALKGAAELDALMERLEFELRTALFCVGARTPAELRRMRAWSWA